MLAAGAGLQLPAPAIGCRFKHLLKSTQYRSARRVASGRVGGGQGEWAIIMPLEQTVKPHGLKATAADDPKEVGRQMLQSIVR